MSASQIAAGRSHPDRAKVGRTITGWVASREGKQWRIEVEDGGPSRVLDKSCLNSSGFVDVEAAEGRTIIFETSPNNELEISRVIAFGEKA
ncbi:MAG: hypothetical protein P4L81_01525 [Candidatus Pacebacteria bacterium]|nr:hypothetical protein [Candidatus Paceibacterota bacterium]